MRMLDLPEHGINRSVRRAEPARGVELIDDRARGAGQLRTAATELAGGDAPGVKGTAVAIFDVARLGGDRAVQRSAQMIDVMLRACPVDACKLVDQIGGFRPV